MPAVERKVGRHHLAFYRGWLQGVDLRELADHYLDFGIDLRLAKSTLTWLQDTFRQAALRHGRHGEARLLRLRLMAHQSHQATAIPSLDDFRAESDPDGFYSEAELIRLYLETFPQAADKKVRQRQRLIERQLRAFETLERLLVTEPVPSDPVSAWFDETVSRRLLLGGILTIGALVERIQQRGYRWWTSVPRIGERGAARIVAWLRGYESTLGPLPAHALSPVRGLELPRLVQARERKTDIVPLEVLDVPQDLSGQMDASGLSSAVQRIEATNDRDAIKAWLATKSGSPNTFRVYRKEAERLLLWAVVERNKALSRLTVEDCTAYRDWLSGLGRTPSDSWPWQVAQERWIGRRNTPRFSPDWRPFDGPLSPSSVRHAINIVSSFFEWLAQVQYLPFNPWTAVGKKPAPNHDAPPDLEMTRAFSSGQWQYLMASLEDLPRSASTVRLRFVLAFAYATGLRLSELVEASVGRLYTMPLSKQVGVRWMLKVLGKGGKWRAVPMPTSLIEQLRDYLSWRELDRDPFNNPPDTPLIARLDGKGPMSPSALYKVLRDCFADVATRLVSQGRDIEAKAFQRATVHWLRHTCGSHLGTSGVPVNLIQKLLGHASLDTTSIYTQTDDEQLWSEMESRA
jgi:site-specific recombinase XerD